MAGQALADGMKGIILPQPNRQEAALVGGIQVIGVSQLKEVIDAIERRITLPDQVIANPSPILPDEGDMPDFTDVRGQDNVKRGLEIAAAGGHNVLLYGSPGVGKTMIDLRLPNIMPPMTPAEILETTRIYSLGAGSEPLTGLVTRRPFRHPHHTASDVAFTVGGSIPLPGEISLAHNGVLFLDELSEVKRSAIEILRQPLEEGRVRLARAKMSLEYPASFMLVAAMNPCFCGYYGHPTPACTCSKRALEFYRLKTSGPLMDRIDLQIEVESVPLGDLMSSRPPGESSATIRARVVKAREMQSRRFKDLPGIYCNARMPEQDLGEHCRMDVTARRFLFRRLELLQVSARSYTRILKVSRTIADLSGTDRIEMEHVAEAVH